MLRVSQGGRPFFAGIEGQPRVGKGRDHLMHGVARLAASLCGLHQAGVHQRQAQVQRLLLIRLPHGRHGRGVVVARLAAEDGQAAQRGARGVAGQRVVAEGQDRLQRLLGPGQPRPALGAGQGQQPRGHLALQTGHGPGRAIGAGQPRQPPAGDLQRQRQIAQRSGQRGRAGLVGLHGLARLGAGLGQHGARRVGRQHPQLVVGGMEVGGHLAAAGGQQGARRRLDGIQQGAGMVGLPDVVQQQQIAPAVQHAAQTGGARGDVAQIVGRRAEVGQGLAQQPEDVGLRAQLQPGAAVGKGALDQRVVGQGLGQRGLAHARQAAQRSQRQRPLAAGRGQLGHQLGLKGAAAKQAFGPRRLRHGPAGRCILGQQPAAGQAAEQHGQGRLRQACADDVRARLVAGQVQQAVLQQAAVEVGGKGARAALRHAALHGQHGRHARAHEGRRQAAKRVAGVLLGRLATGEEDQPRLVRAQPPDHLGQLVLADDPHLVTFIGQVEHGAAVLLDEMAVADEVQDVAAAQRLLDGGQRAGLGRLYQLHVRQPVQRGVQDRQLLRQVDGGELVFFEIVGRGHGHGDAQRALGQRGRHGVGLFGKAGEGGVGRGGQVLGGRAALAGVAQQLPGQGVQLGRARVDVQADAALRVLAARAVPSVAQAAVGQQAAEELLALDRPGKLRALRQAGRVQQAVAQALDAVEDEFDRVACGGALADQDFQVGEVGCMSHGRPSAG